MGTSYTTKESKEYVVPRGINYILPNFGYGALVSSGVLLGLLLLDVFDEQKVPRWVTFLFFLSLALLLRRIPSIANWWRGKDARAVLIYSDSPIWKSYIESRWLPAAGDRLDLI